VSNDRAVALFAIAGALLVGTSAALAQSVRKIEEKQVDLLVGEQTTIPATEVDKYSEGAPGVVEVRLPKDGKQFVIVALAPGKASLLLLMKNGREVRYTFTVRASGVRVRDNIRLDFYFVQLQKKGATTVGIGWPGTIGGTATLVATHNLNDGTTSATASIASQVLPRIDLAQESGWAKIRRQATIVVANGEHGRFSSGGEMNFRVEGNMSSGVQAISFGSEVQVQARYDRGSERLEVRISADVSELTGAGPDGLPGRVMSRVETLVNLKLGECIVLAGLHAESESGSREGLPILSQIPVLGYLFGSQGHHLERTENVLFIVPTVVEAVTLDERERVLEAYSSYRRFEGDFGRALLEEPELPEEEREK
jgi:pilus assembly protein CpaC